MLQSMIHLFFITFQNWTIYKFKVSVLYDVVAVHSGNNICSTDVEYG